MFDKTSGLSIYNSIVRSSRLMIELALCSQRDDLQGIFLSPSYSNPQTWFGIIYVRYGIYSRAAYRFLIIMGDDEYDPSTMKFPKNAISGRQAGGESWSLPRIFFYSPTKPYHPHIDPVTGEFNLSWYFKNWDEKRHHIWHCLKCLKHIFYSKLYKNDLIPQKQPDCEQQMQTSHNKKVTKQNGSEENNKQQQSITATQQQQHAVARTLSSTSSTSTYEERHHHQPNQTQHTTLFNETAAKLYQEDIQEFTKTVEYNIDRTRKELDVCPTVTDDHFEPNFSALNSEDVFLVAKNKMKMAGEKQKLTGWQAQNAQTSGHSFIMPGTIRPFSKYL